MVATGRYSSEITKELWRNLNNKINLAHLLLSCREGHPSDDNILEIIATIPNISSPGATKHKVSCSVLDHFNFINIVEMVAMGPRLWQHILKFVVPIAFN